MCGIVACVGEKTVMPAILDSLKKLEYRGYDSSGVACFCGKEIVVKKTKGTIDLLEEKIDKNMFYSNVAMGHTRWATHGKADETNAHPHLSYNKKVCVVHNGIIENYQVIKNNLPKVTYVSETDTEVFANLLSSKLSKACGEQEVLDCLEKATKEVKGSFAFAIMIDGISDKIFFAKQKSPLILGFGENFSMLCSDECAMRSDTHFVAYLSDGDYGYIEKFSYKVFNKQKEVKRKKEPFCLHQNSLSKGRFNYFMEKEIEEGNFAVLNTMLHLMNSNTKKLENLIKSSNKIFVVGCGTALHAGEIFKFILEKECGVLVSLDFASEFRYKKPNLDKNSLCIFISQSGETADTLACASLAKQKGAKRIAITNVSTSRITKLCNVTIKTYAGVEVSVASTKAYLAQLSALYFLLTLFSKVYDKKLSFSTSNILNIKKFMDVTEKIKKLAKQIKDERSLFFVGRGIDYFLAKEGALKLKEISYIHCEAFAGGELKHGSLSLLDESSFVICVLTQKSLIDKMMSNIIEMQSRGAKVILFSPFCELLEKVFYFVPIKKEKDDLMPFVATKPLQQLALFCSLEKGLNPDMPRNLAKSVTVE